MKKIFLSILLTSLSLYSFGQCSLPSTLTAGITFTDGCSLGAGEVFTSNRNNLNNFATYELIVESNENVTLNFSELSINGSSIIQQILLNVKENGTLTIKGTFNLGEHAALEVAGNLIIEGDFNTPGTDVGYPVISVYASGNLAVTGNAEINDTNGVIEGTFTENGGDEVTGPNLPVELTYFEASSKDGATSLTWETASEVNSSYFEVERSTDKKNWFSLGSVNAAGNSQTLLKYSFVDEEALPGAYYRLKQVDLDGRTEYFGPIEVLQEGVNATLSAVIMPNHISVGESLQVSLSGLSLGADVGIQIYNNKGNLVYTEEIKSVYSNTLLRPMNFQNILGSGLYHVVLKSGNKLVKEKLLVK